MKKAVVTGANGFIGHHFVERLSEQGYSVIAVIRDKQENINNIMGFPNLRIVYCDLDCISKLPELIKEDVKGSVFYHFAWASSSGEARSNYELQLWNAKCSVKAAEAAAKLGCRRIVYSGSVTQLMYRDYLRKDDIIPERTTCYAVGKMAAEYMMKCICPEIGIEWIWTYIANFYGADDPTDNFINMLIKSYHNGVVPELTPATQLADFMYVTDVAQAILEAGEKGKPDTSYYVGYGEPRPLKKFIETVRDCVNPDMDSGIGRKPFRGMNIDFDKVDYEKLHRHTGFTPQITFDQGIKLIIGCPGKIGDISQINR
ncbi:MAG: NAD(P)-dependent oxidoreductase [Lachnospiraceae bacterium]|nr:NAD(P)-dependent oxidoreductase [Lachnospiraceae bacterium]